MDAAQPGKNKRDALQGTIVFDLQSHGSFICGSRIPVNPLASYVRTFFEARGPNF